MFIILNIIVIQTQCIRRLGSLGRRAAHMLCKLLLLKNAAPAIAETKDFIIIGAMFENIFY